MRNTNVLGLIFPNMHDEVLRDLTAIRAFGSVPFGGRYRLIDFALSNMVNAGVSKVGVVTKSNYQSLMDHLGSGKSWDLSRKNEGLYILPPFGVTDEMYAGRISCLAGLEAFFRNSKEDYIIMSDCDVVGNIDFDKLVDSHIASGADVTIAYKNGVIGAPYNVVLDMDGDHRVSDIAINESTDEPVNYGLSIYVINKSTLWQLVKNAVSRNHMSFERDVLQRCVGELRIYGYEVTEMTLVISSLNSYFNANMALLNADIRRRLFTPARQIYTKVRDCCPAIYGLEASVSHSLVADGSRIEGTIRNSIVFRDVQIQTGAFIENCIVMQGSVIGRNSTLNSVILDKDVTIKERRTLQGFESYPIFISKGSTV